MTPIERTLVGWFEVNGYTVEHDGHEWFAWVGERMLPLTEMAVAIKQELGSTASITSSEQK